MNDWVYREMVAADYSRMIVLWREIEGLALSEADSEERIAGYLTRNEGMSFVCESRGVVVGTILAGHDGRRGFLYHVAVSPAYRGKRIAQRLVSLSLAKLREVGIDKCHLFVREDNELGQRFWASTGWAKRSGFYVYSRDVG